MKRRVTALLLALWMAGAHAAAFEPLPPPVAAQGSVQVAFAPWNDVEKLVVDELNGAKKQILIQAYLLTSKKIAGALVAAHRRGIDVQVLMDATQMEKIPASKALLLTDAGVPVWLETAYQNAHNKVIIIDANTATPVLLTGSYNYTWAAAHQNAENLLVLRNEPALAAQYLHNWKRHQKDASRYRPAQPR